MDLPAAKTWKIQPKSLAVISPGSFLVMPHIPALLSEINQSVVCK